MKSTLRLVLIGAAALGSHIAAAGPAATTDTTQPIATARVAPGSHLHRVLTQSEAVVTTLAQAGFQGDLGIMPPSGDGIVRLVPAGIPKAGAKDIGKPWPFASVTKQIVAVMIMQLIEAGELELDASASQYLPALNAGPPAPTIRQLLQHRSGLPNPEDSRPDADGQPGFYTSGPTGAEWCLTGRAAPPAEGWRYNNCDYIVLGAILELVGKKDFATQFRERIAEPGGMRDTHLLTTGSPRRFVGRTDAAAQGIARYGTAGALTGQIYDILMFDRALLDGRLLGPAALAELWEASPSLGFMALGQWVFHAPLKGCKQPVKIVERRGGIGPYQARNFILPEHRVSMVLLTQDAEFDFGEIWTGRGASYDALSAALCGEGR